MSLKGPLLAIAFCLCACNTPVQEKDSLFLTVTEVHQQVTREDDKIYVHMVGQLRKDRDGKYILLDIDDTGAVIEHGPALYIQIADTEVRDVIEDCEHENVGVIGDVVFDELPVLLVEDIDELSDIRRYVFSTCE